MKFVSVAVVVKETRIQLVRGGGRKGGRGVLTVGGSVSTDSGMPSKAICSLMKACGPTARMCSTSSGVGPNVSRFSTVAVKRSFDDIGDHRSWRKPTGPRKGVDQAPGVIV